MSIIAGMSIIQSQLSSAFNLGISGKSSLTSSIIISAVASVVPMAMLPMIPPIPLIPIGISAAINMLNSANNMDIAGKPEIVAQMIATAISIIAPLAPPTGLSLLQSQLKSAFSLGISGKPGLTSQMIALAICNYYQMAPTI